MAAFSTIRLAGAKEPILLFVCTGNTCRSPLAEVLFKAHLGADSGWRILSAGLHAEPGAFASAQAIAVAKEHDADLTAHVAHPVTDALAFGATHIVAMTASHAAELRRRFPFAKDKIRLLGEFAEADGVPRDIPDPFGGSVADYRRCAEKMISCFGGLKCSLLRSSAQ